MKRNKFFKTAGAFTAGLVVIPSLGSSSKEIGTSPKVVRENEGESLNVLGDRMQLKLTGADTDGLFTVIEESNDPGMMIPPHVHDNEDEVFRVLEGSMAYTIAGETQVLGPGDTAFGPKGIPHSWKNVGDGPARVILSAFPAGVEEMFKELDKLPPGPPDFAKVAEVCNRYGVHFLEG